MEKGMEKEMETGCTLICLLDLVRIVANITLVRIVANITLIYFLRLPSAAYLKKTSTSHW